MEKDLIEKIKDPKWYLEHFTKIKGKTPGLQPFVLNEAQKDLFNTLNQSTRVMICKARQIGFSTAVTGYLYHLAITTPGINVALIGYNSDLTAELLDKVKTFYRTTPDSIKPQIQYNSKYEITFPAMDSKIIVLPSTENVGRGYTLFACLSGETGIAMRDNSFKKMKDVSSGDEIINGRGGYSKVVRLLKKKTDKKLLNISSYGSDNLILTEDHKVLTRTFGSGFPVWKEARALTTKDYLAYPYFQCRNRAKSLKIPELKRSSHGGGRWSKIENRTIPITREFGEFIGWYLAEGTFSGNKLSFSVHKDEVEKVLRVVDVIRPFIGSVNVVYRKDESYNGAVIYLYGKEFASFVGGLFGSNCAEKNINQSVWNWGWDVGYGILQGLIAGDGYVKNVKKIQITTVSEKLAISVKRLMVSLRLGLPAVYKTQTTRYGVKTKDRFDVLLGGKGNYKLRRKLGYSLPVYDSYRAKWKLLNAPWANQGGGYWKRGRFYYWSKISSIERAPDEEFVYDIVLADEPHSFLTHAGVVHNCLLTELAFWTSAEEKMLAIENSVPKNGKIIIESTPNAIGNLYHRMWMSDNGYVKKEYGWWWNYSEEEVEDIRRRINNPMRFAQEYELEFLSSGRPVFPSALIKRLKQGVLKVGDKVKTQDGKEHVVSKTEDEVTIYFPSIPGRKYVAGADVAEGVTGGDYSSFTIFDRETGDEVAFWRGYMPADRFGIFLDKWGRIYNDALIVVEINNHGLTTVTALRNQKYPQMYFRPVKFDQMGTNYSDRIGWKTTRVTRPLMIDDFREALQEGSVKIHSLSTIDEMLTFIFDDGGNMVAQSSFHDDCIFASAIAFQGFKIMYSGELLQIDYEKHLPKSSSY